MRVRFAFASICICAVICACGGGGGGTPPAPAPSQAPQGPSQKPSQAPTLTPSASPSPSSSPSPGSSIIEYQLAPNSHPNAMVGGISMPADPDDSYVWFLESGTDEIAKISPSGKVFEYSLPQGVNAHSITMMNYGGDTLCCMAHSYWYVEEGPNEIGTTGPLYPPTQYEVPTKNAGLQGIAGLGYDAAFSENGANKIGVVSLANGFPPAITEYSLPTHLAIPTLVAADASGNFYVLEYGLDRIAQFNLNQLTIVEYQIPTQDGEVTAMAGDPNHPITYFADEANKIGSIAPSGAIQEYKIPTPWAGVNGIAVDRSGNVWFTEGHANRIGMMTPSGTFREYDVPTPNAGLDGISQGNQGTINSQGQLCCADNRIWFTERVANKVGVLSP